MIDVEKESLCINKIVGSNNFEITVQGDSIIPDTKPDILKDINMTGKVCIYKREILDDKIRLDGNVNIYLMYLADSEDRAIRGLNTEIDFTEIFDFPNIEPRMLLDEEIKIKNLECKVLNGRKVSLQATLEVDARVFSNDKEEIVRSIDNTQDIQTQTVTLNMNSLIGQNSCKGLAKENLKIDNTDNLLEILNVDFDIVNQDTKISYNKVLAKADVRIKILYLTEEGEIKKIEEMIPVMGFIDLVGVSEENVCDVKYKLKNISIKENPSEEHSISVEIEVEIFARVFEEKEVSIIQDMYSPSRNLFFKENNVNTMVNMKNTKDIVNIREKMQLDDIEYSKLCDVLLMENINELNISKDRLRCSGDLNLNLLLTNNSENNMETVKRTIPFDFTQEIDGLTKDSKVDLNIVPLSQEFSIDNMQVDTRVNLEVNTNSYNLETVNMIDDIEEKYDEDINPYSMVIYFVKPGDTLWKIAKKYKSTVDDIIRVNNIENPNKINVGVELFIPRCVSCKTNI